MLKQAMWSVFFVFLCSFCIASMSSRAHDLEYVARIRHRFDSSWLLLNLRPKSGNSRVQGVGLSFARAFTICAASTLA